MQKHARSGVFLRETFNRPVLANHHRLKKSHRPLRGRGSAAFPGPRGHSHQSGISLGDRYPAPWRPGHRS